MNQMNKAIVHDGVCLRQQHVYVQKCSGFTLLEMLVVLVIIGLLAGLVGPRLFGKVDSAKVKTAEAQIEMLYGSLEMMSLHISRVPTNQEGLGLLYYEPKDARKKSLWQGPYIREPLGADPWDNPYQYSVPGSNAHPFSLYSFGADGVLGGEGHNADIGYPPQQ